ncbi:putative Alpha/beta hydrolase [Mycena sanguinolenta]|uniref:Putative Alpha/beta hydrolase n=1 Tax=Mycena sanguinolenta TaxID=230812 RepID=A0A8H6Z571_9AGAR|nr:putative Alpha/beta hydrolase [Mycena sanguinolenta]
MTATKTIEVPHLGGTRVGYAISNDSYDVDTSKPTCVLINSMCTTSSLFRAQFSDARLTGAMNLLAIEPLGHGSTACSSDHFTYWDSAITALQVLDRLGIDKFFALGTSQGGWIVTRLALLEPTRVQGLVLLGTSLDCESADSRTKGCWDPVPMFKPFLEKWGSDVPTADFVPDDDWIGACTSLGFGAAVTAENTEFWTKTIKDVYAGDEGRRKLRMAAICLAERDGLLLRLDYVKCPVHWLHGTNDFVYGTQVPAEQIKLFTASSHAELSFVEGGAHYLSASNPKEVNEALFRLVTRAN